MNVDHLLATLIKTSGFLGETLGAVKSMWAPAAQLKVPSLAGGTNNLVTGKTEPAKPTAPSMPASKGLPDQSTGVLRGLNDPDELEKARGAPDDSKPMNTGSNVKKAYSAADPYAEDPYLGSDWGQPSYPGGSVGAQEPQAPPQPFEAADPYAEDPYLGSDWGQPFYQGGAVGAQEPPAPQPPTAPAPPSWNDISGQMAQQRQTPGMLGGSWNSAPPTGPQQSGAYQPVPSYQNWPQSAPAPAPPSPPPAPAPFSYPQMYSQPDFQSGAGDVQVHPQAIPSGFGGQMPGSMTPQVTPPAPDPRHPTSDALSAWQHAGIGKYDANSALDRQKMRAFMSGQQNWSDNRSARRAMAGFHH